MTITFKLDYNSIFSFTCKFYVEKIDAKREKCNEQSKIQPIKETLSLAEGQNSTRSEHLKTSF